MTGPEHYREAERLLQTAGGAGFDGKRFFLGDADAAATIAAAQVHATLALAAAQALQPVTVFMGDDEAVTEWGRVVGHQKVAVTS